MFALGEERNTLFSSIFMRLPVINHAQRSPLWSCCSRAASLHFHVFVDSVENKLWTWLQGLRNIIISLSQPQRVQDQIISSSKTHVTRWWPPSQRTEEPFNLNKWSQIKREEILQPHISCTGTHHPITRETTRRLVHKVVSLVWLNQSRMLQLSAKF